MDSVDKSDESFITIMMIMMIVMMIMVTMMMVMMMMVMMMMILVMIIVMVMMMVILHVPHLTLRGCELLGAIQLERCCCILSMPFFRSNTVVMMIMRHATKQQAVGVSLDPICWCIFRSNTVVYL